MIGRIVGETYLSYLQKPPDVVFWVRTKDGKEKISFTAPIYPDFFVRTRDVPTAEEILTGMGRHDVTPLPLSEATLVEKQDEKVTQYTVSEPKRVAEYRRALESPYKCPRCKKYEWKYVCALHFEEIEQETKSKKKEKVSYWTGCKECLKASETPTPAIICSKCKDHVAVVDKPIVECFEADVPFVRNVKKHMHLYNSIRVVPTEVLVNNAQPLRVEPWTGDVPDLRKGYYDIETDDSEGQKNPPEPDQSRILALSLASDHFNKAITYPEEQDILREYIWHTKNDTDLVIGWNSENFDDEFVDKRSHLHGLEYDRHAFQRLDLYQLMAFKSERRMDSFALKDVTREILVEEQKPGNPYHWDKPTEHLKVHQYYASFNDPARLPHMLEVNFSHAKAVHDLDYALGLIDMRAAMADIAGIMVPDTYYYSRVIDSLAMRRMYDERPRLICRCRTDVKGQVEFKGATVFPTVPGQHDNILHFDLVSLYNRIAQAMNTSPELWSEARKKIELIASPTPEDLIPLLRDLPEGIFPQEMRKLEAWRKLLKADKKKYDKDKESPEYKRASALDRAVKTLILAFYGQLGEPRSRWFVPLMAQLITYTGRQFIEETARVLKEFGFEILYGDTDSIFAKYISLGKEGEPITTEDFSRMGKSLEAFLNQWYPKWVSTRWGLSPERARLFAIEFAEVYDTIFFGESKKKYAGITHGGSPDSPEIVGFEKVRSDWCKVARDMQEEIIKMRLKRLPKTDIKAYVIKVKNDLLDAKVDLNKLVISKGVKKNTKEYKNLPPHVRAAMQIEAVGGKVESRVRYVILTAAKGKMEKIQALGEDDPIPKPEMSARIYYWENQVFPPTKRVLWGMFGEDEFAQMSQCKATPMEAFF